MIWVSLKAIPGGSKWPLCVPECIGMAVRVVELLGISQKDDGEQCTGVPPGNQKKPEHNCI